MGHCRHLGRASSHPHDPGHPGTRKGFPPCRAGPLPPLRLNVMVALDAWMAFPRACRRVRACSPPPITPPDSTFLPPPTTGCMQVNCPTCLPVTACSRARGWGGTDRRSLHAPARAGTCYACCRGATRAFLPTNHPSSNINSDHPMMKSTSRYYDYGKS